MGVGWTLCVVVTLWSLVSGQIQWEDLNIVGVRLADGPNAFSGRVELGIREGPGNQSTPVWGTVCDDEWDDFDANVICRMLNYSYGGKARGRAHFGQGEGPIWLDDAGCDGRETDIQQCWGIIAHDCDHLEDAGVECDPRTSGPGIPSLPPKSNPQTIRPIGDCFESAGLPRVSLLSYGHPDIRSAGVVQVFLEGRWGSVCDDYFDLATAKIFCRLMCFFNDDEVTIGAPEDILGRAVLPFVPFDLQCRGDEIDMNQCIRGPADPFGCGPAEAATVSCRNISSYFQIISLKTCKIDTDYRGTVWHPTRVNVTAVSSCPFAYKGLAFRKCSSNATWEEPHYNQCVKIQIYKIVNEISTLNHSDNPRPHQVFTAVRDLADATDGQNVYLTSGDIKAVVSSLPTVVSLDKRTEAGINVTEAFVSVASNLMTESARREWISVQEEKDSRTFVKLLNGVTDAGFVAANKTVLDGEAALVARENIVFEAGRVTAKDISFPKVQHINDDDSGGNVDGLDCRQAVSTNLRKATLENIQTSKGVHPYTASLYHTLAYLQAGVEAEYVASDNISSQVPSVAIHVDSNKEITLDPPLEIVFRACVTRRRVSGSPNNRNKRDVDEEETEIVQVPPPLNCVRKEEKGNWIVWTTANCEVVKNTKDFTECRCSKSGHTASSFEKFLKFLKEFLAKYACLFPILAVIFKIMKTIYAECKNRSSDNHSATLDTKLAKLQAKCALISDQPIRKLMIGLILCFIIIISNVELIAAVDKTENRESCMAIAGTLHFFFLVECFYFIAQAVDIFLPNTLWIPWFLLLIGLPWVFSMILVGVAVGTFSREDYLGENICWLSKESGSYLFLIIPAACVPVIQLIGFVKKSREQPCGCESDENKKAWQKVKSWVTNHKHLLEFGLGIALMSSQVFISLFADDDTGVKDVFFGLFTFAKGLILAITGISEDGESKKTEDENKTQDLTNINDTTDNDSKKSSNSTPNQDRRNGKQIAQAFENPIFTRPDHQQKDTIGEKGEKKTKNIDAVYQNTGYVSDASSDHQAQGSDTHCDDKHSHHENNDQTHQDQNTNGDNESDAEQQGSNDESAVYRDNESCDQNDETGTQQNDFDPVYQNCMTQVDKANESEGSDQSDEVQNEFQRRNNPNETSHYQNDENCYEDGKTITHDMVRM